MNSSRFPMDLHGKIALITGGGTGIGRSTAFKLAAYGVHVVLCGRRYAVLRETAELIRGHGGSASAVAVDVTDRSQVSFMVNSVISTYDKIDILINNAGCALYKTLFETSEQEWDEVISTNLKGVFLCCNAVTPVMKRFKGGIIVNISSILGIAGIANMGAYCASKFGVIGLTQSLAGELHSFGINVYAICPGATNTLLHRTIVGELQASTSMSPEIVADTICDVVTGAIIIPTGKEIVIDEQGHRSTRSPSDQKASVMISRLRRSLSLVGKKARRFFTP